MPSHHLKPRGAGPMDQPDPAGCWVTNALIRSEVQSLAGISDITSANCRFQAYSECGLTPSCCEPKASVAKPPLPDSRVQ
jgi:hypothetical protein